MYVCVCVCLCLCTEQSKVALMCEREQCAGVKLGGVPPDLRSGTSYLRSATSNNRSCTSQLRSGTFCWDQPLCTVYILVFFSMHDVL